MVQKFKMLLALTFITQLALANDKAMYDQLNANITQLNGTINQVKNYIMGEQVKLKQVMEANNEKRFKSIEEQLKQLQENINRVQKELMTVSQTNAMQIKNDLSAAVAKLDDKINSLHK